MERTILHLDLDTFFVSVERLRNPSLRGVPVIVGGTTERGVVSSCSYEARCFGVHSGMAMRMAQRLCPTAVVVRGDLELYCRCSHLVTDIIADRAPIHEKMSIDEHFIDLSGMDRFHGCYQWAHELRMSIMQETGLPISFGLSQNKTVSKIATGQAKPNGELWVKPHEVQSFLDPLSVRKIPMVGTETYKILHSMGIETIGDLRKLPPAAVERALGKVGLVAWKKANGEDDSPVCPCRERKSISREHTFEQDIQDKVRVRQCLSDMVERLSFELRAEQKMTGSVAVKIRYANFDTHDCQSRIAYTAFDHLLLKTVNTLFDRLYNPRMMIRLVGVRFGELVGGAQQLDLFSNQSELSNLYLMMDNIRRRFGRTAVRRAGSMTEENW